MIRLSEAGKVQTVIVKDMSRMGRDYLKVGYYTESFFAERDIRYIAINDGVDSDKGDNDFTLEVEITSGRLSWIEYFRAKIQATRYAYVLPMPTPASQREIVLWSRLSNMLWQRAICSSRTVRPLSGRMTRKILSTSACARSVILISMAMLLLSQPLTTK